VSRSRASGVVVGPTGYAIPTLKEARALQALSKGKASEQEQLLAFHWLLLKACRSGDEVMVPGQPDATAYLAGRRSVCLQIGWVLGQQAEAFRKQGEQD